MGPLKYVVRYTPIASYLSYCSSNTILWVLLYSSKLSGFLEFCSKINILWWNIREVAWCLFDNSEWTLSVIHPCLVWLNRVIREKFFMIPFRVMKIMKVFYLKSLGLYGIKVGWTCLRTVLTLVFVSSMVSYPTQKI